MDFKEKYTQTADKTDPKNKDKIVLTDFEFAFLEALNKIADALGVRR